MNSRRNLTQTVAAVGLFLPIATESVGLQLLPANTMRTALRQLYSPSKVLILTLLAPGRDESCGWYQADGDASRWRYLNSGQGLRSEAWTPSTRLASHYPATAIEPDVQWRRRMQTPKQGSLFDWMTSPLVIAYLNAT